MILSIGTETLIIKFNSGFAISVDGHTEEVMQVCNCDLCDKHPEIDSCICEIEGRLVMNCKGVIVRDFLAEIK